MNVEGVDKRATMNAHQSAGHRQPNRHGAFRHQDHRDERLPDPVAMKLKGDLHFESSDVRQRSHPIGTTPAALEPPLVRRYPSRSAL